MTEPSKSDIFPIVAIVSLMILAGGLSTISIRSEAPAMEAHTFTGTEPNAPGTPEAQPPTF